MLGHLNMGVATSSPIIFQNYLYLFEICALYQTQVDRCWEERRENSSLYVEKGELYWQFHLTGRSFSYFCQFLIGIIVLFQSPLAIK